MAPCICHIWRHGLTGNSNRKIRKNKKNDRDSTFSYKNEVNSPKQGPAFLDLPTMIVK